MACFRPVSVNTRANGLVAFYDKPGDQSGSSQVACGKCVGCRLDRAAAWSTRCMHEASLFDHNSFVTLTYADENLPPRGSLRYRDVQLFMKRLRKSMLGMEAGPNGRFPIRFFCAGEYGDNTARPHYHLLLFNLAFNDRRPIGARLFESARLSELWPHGHASVGSVTPASVAYVSQYCMKKVYGRVEADEHYGSRALKAVAVRDNDGGVWYQYHAVGPRPLAPEFVVMSRRPGIGAWWFEKYSSDVLPRDYVVAGGAKKPVPRYYAKKYAQDNEAGYELVKEAREAAAVSRSEVGRLRERLAAREAITLSERSLLQKERKV